MADTQIIAASFAAAVGAGFTLREVFKRAVIGKACRVTAQKIKDFKTAHSGITPMPPDRKASADVLRDTILAAHKMRAEKMEDAKKIKLPNPKIPMDLPELQATFEANRGLFLKSLKTTYKYKIKHLYIEAVAHKINASQGLQGTFDFAQNIGEKVHPDLDFIDGKIVEALDALGATDFGAKIGHEFVQAFEPLQQFVHDNIPHIEPLLGQLGDALHGMADTLHAFPGIWSAAGTIKDEIKMMLNNETSFEDAIENGIGPALMKIVALKAGIALDSVTGATGAFTTLFSAITRTVLNDKLMEKNEKLRAEFNEIIDEIKRCHDRILRHINQKAREFEESFARLIEQCPNIDEEPPLKIFIDELKQVFALSFSLAERTLAELIAREIENIPEDTDLEKILFIRKREAIKRMYLQAERELYTMHENLINNFTLAAERSPEEALDYMMKNVVFDRPETMTVLQKIEAVIEATTQTYLVSLAKWETSLLELRKKGEEEMAKVIKEQVAIYDEFVEERKPCLHEINNKIKLNNRRLGMKEPKNKPPNADAYGEAEYV